MSALWWKQSTAVTERIGPCLDSAGAEYTGLVIGDLTLTKNGTSAAMAAAATLTHIENGYYSLVTIAGNSDTLGVAQVSCNKATYQMPIVNHLVVPAMVYDSIVLGTDVLQTDVTQLLGTAWLAPATAGTPDVNAKLIGATAQTGLDLGGNWTAARAAKVDEITAARMGALTDWINDGRLDLLLDNVVNATSLTLGSVYGAAGQVLDAAATTLSFKTDLTEADGFWNDALVVFQDGALAKQSRIVQSYVQLDGRITFDEATTSAPANFVSFFVKVGHNHTVTDTQSGLATEANATTNRTTITDAIATVQSDTDNIQTRIPAALVGGRMDASVGAMASGVITDAAITAPSEAAGRPTTILAMIRRLWEWNCNKRTRDRSSGAKLLRNAADTATLETQTQSTSGTTDTESIGS